MVAEFPDRRAVKNIGGGIRAIERQDADLVVGNTTMDKQKNRFRRHGRTPRLIDRHIDLRFHPSFGGGQSFSLHSASSHSAAPCPPPTQRETSARFARRRFNSFKLDKISLAPVAPTGWPSAIAPPFTFNFSCGTTPGGASRCSILRANFSDFIASSTASACAAKASLISMRSAWARVKPVCASAL